MSDVKKISSVGNIYGWEESEFGEFVLSEDYDALEAEAQALREERDRIERNRDMWKGQCERQAEKLAALRARVVVVPERKNRATTIAGLSYDRGWNACLDELARLNSKVVSEGLLRDLLKSAQKLSDRASNFMVSGVEFIEIGDNNSAVMELEVTLEALRAVLDDGKEVKP